VLPAELTANAGAESLGDRLLRRKARRQKRPRRFIRQAVADLVRVQDAVQKPLPKLLMRSLDPRHLNDVNANAQDHRDSPKSRVQSPKPKTSLARDFGLWTLNFGLIRFIPG